MSNLIRGEAIKMRSTRTAIGFLIAGVGLTLLFVLISTLADEPATEDAKREAISVAPLFILFLVFGVVGATGEYRHRTVAPAVLIAPDRLRLLTARMLAYAVTGAGVALAMVVVALAIGLPLMTGNPGEAPAFGEYAGVVGGTLLLGAVGGALGVGFGALVGNQVAGVVTVLIYLLIVDGLIGLADSDLTPYTLGAAATQMGGIDTDDAFGFAGSLAVLAGWTAVFVGAGLARESRREVS